MAVACVNTFPFVFMCLHYKTLENTVGKGEIARNEQVFSTFMENSCHFHQI